MTSDGQLDEMRVSVSVSDSVEPHSGPNYVSEGEIRLRVCWSD